jgi:ubiquinol-cytochrome c reductase cytochrome c1 subunit
MLRKHFKGIAVALSLGLAGTGVGAGAMAAGGNVELLKGSFSFDSLFGSFDRASLQRGFQVYKEVCSGCHGMSLLSYRNLAGGDGLGYTEDEVKAIAAAYNVPAAPNDAGEIVDRPARPSDRFYKPFPNEQAARAANNGAYPPDLSLITKARVGGHDYVYSLLQGYVDPPAGVTVADGMYYNKYFPGNQIGMPAVVSDGSVTFSDGSPSTVQQISHDVATFLTWAAEPEMERRKRTGVQVMLFLIVLTGMLYAVKRKIWSDVH